MCGIAGFCSYMTNFNDNRERWNDVLTGMRTQIHRRGPDSAGEHLENHVGLSHIRLAIRDIEGGAQPMIRDKYVIVYNGEIYNADGLKTELKKAGFIFETTSDTEVILNAFIHYGPDFVEKLNGIFAFVI